MHGRVLPERANGRADPLGDLSAHTQMTPNAKRFTAFVTLIIAFTGLHFACWWSAITSTHVGPGLLLSLPIAFPVMSFFALVDWPDGTFVLLGIYNSAFWGLGLAILALRVEHMYSLASHSSPSGGSGYAADVQAIVDRERRKSRGR